MFFRLRLKKYICKGIYLFISIIWRPCKKKNNCNLRINYKNQKEFGVSATWRPTRTPKTNDDYDYTYIIWKEDKSTCELLFALFAVLAVAFANPNPKPEPQVLAAYPAAAAYPYAYAPVAAAYSAPYAAYPYGYSAYYVR
ncbi:unnamed protein product [Spodoptera exigua]|nr:unnamed protein product [Spodoptera exigua]